MENTRERERAELYKTIWGVANDLRGAASGDTFKSYILGFIFYRYISETIRNFINKNEREAGDLEFDYANLSDEEAEQVRRYTVENKGCYIAPSELFSNVLKYANLNKEDAINNLNTKLSTVFSNIEKSAVGEESEKDFAGIFSSVDLNDGRKLGGTIGDDGVRQSNARIIKIMNAVNDMQIDFNGNNAIDLLGDAYEYLIGMYAANAGKSGGEFYTPQEVSELLARLATVGKTKVNKVYDPTCGSGSLLLKAAKILGKENVGKFCGQELNYETFNLCRINMFLHNIESNRFDIANGDTLTNPKHWDEEPFEVIVSNPPYSVKWVGDDDPTLINDERFSPAGVLAPKSKGDFAFIMHSLSWLSNTGTAAIVCFPGIMYRSGAEQKIRKYLVDNNFVDCIIQLPDNLFYGTSIATCIMVLKRNKKDTSVLFIDASKEFLKATNNNKMEEKNIQNIVGYFKDRKDVDYISKLASYDLIKENDYNLSVSTYVEKEDTRERVDIVKLNAEIDEIVKKENALREQINEIIKEIE